jgi:tRNA-modifying protein YgfZ
VEVTGDGGYFALRDGLGALSLERDVVRVSGPDAESYLQGQTSQDVAGLGTGESAWALVLQPQGKLDAFVRVHKVGPTDFLLDTDAGMGAPLVARLQRFKLRTKADVEQLDWRAVAVRGPRAAPAPLTTDNAPSVRPNVVVAPFQWGGLAGYDLLGPAPPLPPGASKVEPGAYEAARVEAGFPRHGAELDERTIPAEAGLVEASVSFTKGCYTGQELVARIDSRGGNVPRHLRALVLSGPARPGARLYRAPVDPAKVDPAKVERASAEVADAPDREVGDGPGAQPVARGDEKEVGRLTSVALSPRLGWVALGYVARGVDVGSAVLARDEQGEVQARVELLPLM